MIDETESIAHVWWWPTIFLEWFNSSNIIGTPRIYSVTTTLLCFLYTIMLECICLVFRVMKYSWFIKRLLFIQCLYPAYSNAHGTLGNLHSSRIFCFGGRRSRVTYRIMSNLFILLLCSKKAVFTVQIMHFLIQKYCRIIDKDLDIWNFKTRFHCARMNQITTQPNMLVKAEVPKRCDKINKDEENSPRINNVNGHVIDKRSENVAILPQHLQHT